MGGACVAKGVGWGCDWHKEAQASKAWAACGRTDAERGPQQHHQHQHPSQDCAVGCKRQAKGDEGEEGSQHEQQQQGLQQVLGPLEALWSLGWGGQDVGAVESCAGSNLFRVQAPLGAHLECIKQLRWGEEVVRARIGSGGHMEVEVKVPKEKVISL